MARYFLKFFIEFIRSIIRNFLHKLGKHSKVCKRTKHKFRFLQVKGIKDFTHLYSFNG